MLGPNHVIIKLRSISCSPKIKRNSWNTNTYIFLIILGCDIDVLLGCNYFWSKYDELGAQIAGGSKRASS